MGRAADPEQDSSARPGRHETQGGRTARGRAGAARAAELRLARRTRAVELRREGRTQRAIAIELGITERTVYRYLAGTRAAGRLTAEERGVNAGLTPKALSEARDYFHAACRFDDRLGRLVAEGDVDSLPLLVRRAKHVDEVLRRAVARLREDHGYSWHDVGLRLGISKQAAQQRWGGER